MVIIFSEERRLDHSIGFLFTYAGCTENHAWYATDEGQPFISREDAQAAAEDPEYETSEWAEAHLV